MILFKRIRLSGFSLFFFFTPREWGPIRWVIRSCSCPYTIHPLSAFSVVVWLCHRLKRYASTVQSFWKKYVGRHLSPPKKKGAPFFCVCITFAMGRMWWSKQNRWQNIFFFFFVYIGPFFSIQTTLFCIGLIAVHVVVLCFLFFDMAPLSARCVGIVTMSTLLC